MIAVSESFTRSPAKTKTKTLKARGYEYHESVLLAEVVKFLAPAPGRIIVDGTLGGGGGYQLARGAHRRTSVTPVAACEQG